MKFENGVHELRQHMHVINFRYFNVVQTENRFRFSTTLKKEGATVNISMIVYDIYYNLENFNIAP